MLTLGFEDLATIVDGKPGEDIAMKPFTRHFSSEKILGGWEKVGFVPFTRKCVFDKKVRHEVGQKIANEDIDTMDG